MNLNERSFGGMLKDVKIKGEGIDKACELKLSLPFQQSDDDAGAAAPRGIDVTALSSWVGQNVQITIRGAGRGAQLPLPLGESKPEEEA